LTSGAVQSEAGEKTVMLFRLVFAGFCWLGLGSLIAGMLLGVGESAVDFWRVFLARDPAEK